MKSLDVLSDLLKDINAILLDKDGETDWEKPTFKWIVVAEYDKGHKGDVIDIKIYDDENEAILYIKEALKDIELKGQPKLYRAEEIGYEINKH